MRPSPPRIAALAALVVLAACGKTTMPWSSETPPTGGGAPSFSLSPGSLSFTALENGSTPAPQAITVTATGGPLYLVVSHSGPAIASVVPNQSSATITVSVPDPVTVGTTTGTVTVRGYLDSGYTEEIAGSPKTVSVSYVVSASTAPGISVAAGTSVSFTAPAGRAAPAPQTFAVAIANGPVTLQVTPSGAAVASASIVAQTATSATVEVVPAAPTASQGVRSGSVQVLGCLDVGCAQQVAGSPRDVAVSFTTTASQFQAAPQTLPTFPVVAGTGPTAPQTIALSDANGTAAWSTSVYYPGATGWVSVTPSSGTDLPASPQVSVSFPENATAGTYTAYVNVTSLGTTRQVQVSASVTRPRIVAPPDTLAFSAVRNQTTLPVVPDVALTTEHGGSLTFTTSVTYAGATGWLSVAPSGSAPGTLAVGVSTADLAEGTHTATLRLTPSNGATATLVDVSYTISAPTLTALPSPLSFTVDALTTVAATSAPVSVASAGAPLSWSASASQPWVQVSPASGSTPATPTVSLVLAELEALPPGAHAATVTFTYETAPGVNATANVAVNLLVDLPLLTVVAPRVSVAGVGGEVVLRGIGLPAPLAAPVRFGGVDATAQARISATELRATPPGALGAGSHLVTISNALGLSRSRARLEVVDAGPLAAAAVASAGTKVRIVYDDAAKVVYVANAGTGKLERHREAAGWVKAGDGSDEIALASLKNVALSPDGKTLVSIAGTAFRLVDTATFALAASQPAATAPSQAIVHLEMTHAGKAIFVAHEQATFTTAGLFDLASGTTSSIQGLGSLYGAGLVSGPNGSRVGFLQWGISPSAMRVWEAGSGTLTTATNVVQDGWFGSFDRSAARLLVYGHYSGYWGSRLYDASASYALLSGTVPPNWITPPGGATPPTLAVVLSPLGRARAFTWDGTSVRCFDTAGTPDANGVHPLLFAKTPAQAPGASAVLAISTDERTAFVAGADRLVVVPLDP